MITWSRTSQMLLLPDGKDRHSRAPTRAARRSGIYPHQEAEETTWRPDGRGHDVNVVFGLDTPAGRGNITGYLGYRETNALTQSERDFSACTLSVTGAGDTCGGSATIPTGLFTPFDDTFYYTVDGNEFVPWDFTLYNYGPPNHFQRPDERYTAGLFGHYEVSERLEGYVEFQFMDDRTVAQIAPAGAFFVTSTLNCGNTLLSAQQFAAIGCASPADVVPLYTDTETPR